MTPRYDVAVVGLGLFGSACLRSLAERGANAIGVGPAEPEDWASHDGVFASHYDSGRITRRIDRNETWAELAIRSIEAYAGLEERTGIRFHHPVGTLWADADRERIAQIASVAAGFDVPCKLGETTVAESVRGFALPAGLSYAYEAAPAGYIDPRKLVDAQLAAATDAGATVVREAVVSRERTGATHRLATSGAVSLEAERVVLATGSYANAYDLAPAPLPLRIKTELTMLAAIRRDGAAASDQLPTLIYGLPDSPLEDAYLVPPTTYPDGNTYLKLGAETGDDQVLSTREELNEWMRFGDSERHHGSFRELLSSLLPDLPLENTTMKRCLIAYTAHGLPYVDEIDDNVFVGVGGNGRGAKSSDAIGAAAADLALGSWNCPIGRDHFRVPADSSTVPEHSPM